MMNIVCSVLTVEQLQARRRERLAAAADRRLALVLVDLQNDYCAPGGVFERAGMRVDGLDKLVASTNRLVAAARAGGHIVIWVRMVWDEDGGPGLLAERSPFLAREGLRRGTWGAEPLDGLDVAPDDAIVEKRRFSAFFDTGLEELLLREGVDTIVTGGVRTDFCVESTVRDAFFRDIEVLVVADAVAGYVPDLHEHSLREMGTVFAEVVTVDDALGVLASNSKGEPATWLKSSSQ
jgi:ureidoacrylate peracid hydrolase